MATNLDQMNAHLKALRSEVAQLHQELHDAAVLEREAAFQELLDALAPAVRTLTAVEASVPSSPTSNDGPTRDSHQPSAARPEVGERCRLARDLGACLERLGLSRTASAGQLLELWPEQAAGEMTLGEEVDEDASLVRVEVLASGWAWGNKVIARPVGRVCEVVKCGD